MRLAAAALILAALLPLALSACGGAEPASEPAHAADGTLDLLFLNQLDGFAEGVPCDSGSISPLASAAVLRDRLVEEGHPAVLLVAIGNSLFGHGAPRPLKALNTALLGRGDAVIDAFAAARMDLWVPGPVEMAVDADHVLSRAAEAGLPVLISNRHPMQDEDRPDEILTWRIVDAGDLRIALLGMIGQPPQPDPELIEVNPDRRERSRLEVHSAVASARDLSAELRAEHGVHVVIVLSALARGVNLRLAQTDGVDMVIGSTGERFPAGRVVIEGSAAMLSAEDQGREVGHVTLRVRDGDLQFVDLSPLYTLPVEAAPLEKELELLAARFGTADVETLARLAAPGNVDDFVLRYRKIEDAAAFVARYAGYEGSALTHRPAELPTPPPDHPVLEALERQGPDIEDALARTRMRRAILPEGPSLIPVVDACVTCHERQVRFWEQTAHAGAYRTLTARERGRDPACLPCHAAGFGEPAGWLDPRLDAPLGPVTCFSCHRLTAIHAANRLQVLNPAHYISEAQYMDCETCHDPMRSPGFDRQSALGSVTCPPMETAEPALVFARERALETLEARQGRDVVDPQDDYLAGLGLIGLGRVEEGARKLLEAATANVDDLRQAVESARALDGAGRSYEALVVLRSYLDHQTGDPTANLEHVRLLLQARDASARDPRAALAVIDLLLPDDPQDLKNEHLPFRVLKVDALDALGRKQDALTLLEELARGSREDPEVARRLADRGLAPR